MKTEILKVLNLKKFFSIINYNGSNVDFTFLKPSKKLIKNIHVNWLRFTLNKTQKHMPVYLNKDINDYNKREPVSCIRTEKMTTDILTHKLQSLYPECGTKLTLEIVLSHKDIMQHFIQWQRYRKYWWSLITTTPSLFTVNDMKYDNNDAYVDILATFPFGTFPVERIDITCHHQTNYCLSCTISLENALFILLLDALSNYSKEKYLRLHRKITPYKIAFGLNDEDDKIKEKLGKLAQFLYKKLESNKISALLPSMSVDIETHIKESLEMGVTYTAVLDKSVLENGIFKLLNSSTMLHEQVHVADFHEYASNLFNY